MLQIQLDDEAEKYLVEILAQEKTTSSELIKILLRDRYSTLQPRKTFLERRGGHPKHLLQDGPTNLSDRDVRKKIIADHVQKRHERHQKQEV